MKTEFTLQIIGFFNLFFHCFQFLINYKTGVKDGQIHRYDMYDCYKPKPSYIEKTKLPQNKIN